MRDSIHNRIITSALRQGWQTGNWREAFIKKCKENPDWYTSLTEDETDPDTPGGIGNILWHGFNGRPDAWRIVVEGDLLVMEFLEVEVTHPMPLHKRDAYIWMWWRFDGTDYFHMRGYRADRYGPIVVWLDAEEVITDPAAYR